MINGLDSNNFDNYELINNCNSDYFISFINNAIYL